MHHFLFRCPNALRLWQCYGLEHVVSSMPTGHMVQWLHDNYNQHGVVFPMILWIVWRSQNMKVFENKDECLFSMQARTNSLCSWTSRA